MSDITPEITDYANARSKDELIAQANELNIDASGTKVDIAARILERQEEFAPGEEPGEEPAEDENLPNEERTVTVHTPTHYKQLAKDVGYNGDFRELAAYNGVKNGRYEIEPGTTVRVPPNQTPIRTEPLPAPKRDRD